MSSSLPIPATSSQPASLAARGDPAGDASRVVARIESGQLDEAKQLFARLMGVQDPNEIPPVSTADTSSYEAALLTQVGAQMQIRQWAMNSLPRMLREIKMKD